MNVSSVTGILGTLASAYPNTKLPQTKAEQGAMAEVWHMVLGELEEKYVLEATRRWVMTEQWFPAPAQIRKSALRLQAGLMEPAQAWNEAIAMVESRNVMTWRQTHPIVVQALRDIGGPQVVTMATDTTRVRDMYIKAYDARVQEVFTSPVSNISAMEQIANGQGTSHALVRGDD